MVNMIGHANVKALANQTMQRNQELGEMKSQRNRCQETTKVQQQPRQGGRPETRPEKYYI